MTIERITKFERNAISSALRNQSLYTPIYEAYASSVTVVPVTTIRVADELLLTLKATMTATITRIRRCSPVQ